MSATTSTAAVIKPVQFSLGYKFTWGLAALGTSLISGIYGAMLPIFFQDYLGLAARWIAIASAIYAIWNALNDPRVHVHLARRYEQLGRRSAAAQHLDKATRLGSESALAWYELGQFWFAPASMDDAMSAWRRYLELEPTGTRAERVQGRFK